MIIGDKSTLAFDVSPVVPTWERRFAPEKSAWAGLAVWVSGENVCRFVSPNSDRACDRVFVPLGPIANWIVRNWNAISYEERPALLPSGSDPRRAFSNWCRLDPPHSVSDEDWYELRREWWSRHFWEADSQGSILPDIAFVRDCDHLLVSWAAVCPKSEAFRPQGVARLLWTDARDIFAEFVSVVASSFRDSGHASTFDWIAKNQPLSEGQASSALALFVGRTDAELRALLGVPPSADITQSLRLRSAEPDSSSVSQILRDLPRGVSQATIAASLALDSAADAQVSSSVEAIRQLGRQVCLEVDGPEEQGHEAARALRQKFALDGEPISDHRFSEITAKLGLVQHSSDSCTSSGFSDAAALLVSHHGGSSHYCLSNSQRLSANWARRFEGARCIGNLMLDPYRSGVLGRASSPWSSDYFRRRSGAFAAELILPASGLRKRGLSHLDAAARPATFRSLLADYEIGASAAAWQLWNSGFLSSAELRDWLIDEFGTSV